ncbi:autotransporter outer membrane beta-barrel domain-containing protein [Marinitoga aeolica]|uniref:Uncharacterized protein n=1 Tax=Marinitoga aeolica TaxID=2809031 RepID=A0ABY8PSP0_9BACT|nr:hypothetical protein [Marinitoga aeolica]WGS65645.1 hypothetical protein JRV97_03575 [Marinitoga aeolica]
MKKAIIIGIAILLLLSLSSCVKSIKVKTKPKIGVPVAATTVALNNFVNIEDSIKSALPDAKVESVNGIQTIKYATGLNLDLSQSFEKIDAFSTSVSQNISVPDIGNIDPVTVDVPNINDIPAITVDVPSFDFNPQNITVNVPQIDPAPVSPNITIGELDVASAGVDLPAVDLSIPVAGDTGDGSITSTTLNANDSFSTLTFSTGSLTLDVVNNDDTATVKVDGIIENANNGNLVSNVLTLNPNSTGTLTFDLTNKSISDGATITLRATITNTSSTRIGTYSLQANNLQFSNGTKIKAAEGITFNTSKSITETIDPNMGSTEFSTVTIDGTFNVNIQLPSEWTNVKTEFEATVTYNFGSENIVLVNDTFNSSKDLTFNGKELPPNGSFEFTIDSTFTNNDGSKANIDFTKSPTITVTPDIKIMKIDGVGINNTQNMNLPDNIKHVILSGGKISIDITDTNVSSIVANFTYFDGTEDKTKEFAVENNKAVLDMDGIKLTGENTKDATIMVKNISLDFGNNGLSNSELSANVVLDEPSIKEVKLSLTTKQKIDIPDEIEEVKFMSGSLTSGLSNGSISSVAGNLETGYEDISLTTDNGTLTVNLANKLLSGTKDATLNISEMLIDFSSNPLSFGNQLSVSSSLNDLKISEATITTNLSQSINIPNTIKKVIFGSGSIEVNVDNVQFTSFDGTLTYESTDTSFAVSPEGSAVIDLTNLQLGFPSAEVTIDKIGLKSTNGISLGSSLNANINLVNPKIKYAEISPDSDLKVTNSQVVEFPPEAKDFLNSVTFTGTSNIRIEWNNELPVVVNVNLSVPELTINESFPMSGENYHEVALANKTIDLDTPMHFDFEASPANYDDTNNILKIDISDPNNYLSLGSEYTLAATISLDYELDASIKPFSQEIIPQSDPLNFEIPISDDTTLTLNDIEINGFIAKIVGTIPSGLVNSNNKITLYATYTMNNTEKSTNVEILLDNEHIEKDISEFLKEILKGKDVYMSMKSNNITASLNDLSNFIFDFKIDLTIPLSFDLTKNENLNIMNIKGEADILGREPGSNETDLPIDLVIGEEGKLILHLNYNNTSGLKPGLKITGRNSSNPTLYERDIILQDGKHDVNIIFDKSDIDKIMNNNPYYLDFDAYIPANTNQSFRTNGQISINAWVEVVTDVNVDLLGRGE